MHHDERPCAHCDCWKRVRPDGLCMACYQYRRRTGVDRPIGLIIAQGRRWEERQAG